ncbi:hypothetical protein SanaruYs_14880 [Chryseotalea sanaruensis]|uniref:Uncharacterized protein n=2 Tax=Chryseotalea sanaruensis TaxID=2482724 RepID=A0A401U8R8_9BACT|nr:hypothetical protein SanaruYs_14880 [Chryseotalea sanaruensis]
MIMRLIYAVLFFLLLNQYAFAQRTPKVTKSQTKQLTPEQRLVLESNRKSKGGKKKLSMKRRVRIDKKQDRKARKIRHSGHNSEKRIQRNQTI